MYPLYNSKKEFEIYSRVSGHVGPHLHNSMECVYVQEGTLELGVERELYHMEKGDLGLVFPNTIHHYQVFSPGPNRVLYMIAAPSMCGSFLSMMKDQMPENPVIPAAAVHRDVLYALDALKDHLKKWKKEYVGKGSEAAKAGHGVWERKTEKKKGQEENQEESVEGISPTEVLLQSYTRIILARTLPLVRLIEKGKGTEGNLMDQVVNYVASHYQEEISLTSVAHDLYISPYALSRVFSNHFQMNFNRYVNLIRLEYAKQMLEYTDKSVTDICLDAGFGSQRTFNRVFKEELHMSPAEYRKTSHGPVLEHA